MNENPALGNRLSRTDSVAGTTSYAYNAANMLTGSTGANASTYTNDADGDTLSGGGRGETWDSQNRLVGCSYGSSTDSFQYGADGLHRCPQDVEHQLAARRGRVYLLLKALEAAPQAIEHPNNESVSRTLGP